MRPFKGRAGRFLSLFLAGLILVLSPGLECAQVLAASFKNQGSAAGQPIDAAGAAHGVPKVELGKGLPLSAPLGAVVPPGTTSGITPQGNSEAQLALPPSAVFPAPNAIPPGPAKDQTVLAVLNSDVRGASGIPQKPSTQEFLQSGVEAVQKAQSEGERRGAIDKIYTGESKRPEDAGFPVLGQGVSDAAQAGLVQFPVGELKAVANDPKKLVPERMSAVKAIADRSDDPAKLALEEIGTSNPDGNAADYEVKRAALRALAGLGKVVSLPPVSAAHEAEILGKLSREKPDAAAFDWDKTLEEYQEPGSRETGTALKTVADNGIEVMVLTDRPDVKEREEDVTILESLSTLLPDERDSISVGAKRGAKILLFEKGEPRLIREEPHWTEPQRQVIVQASDLVTRKYGAYEYRGRTSEIGEYHFVQFLPVGTSSEDIQAAAQMMQAELEKRGIQVPVIGRNAYKPTDPPYVTFSKVDKSLGVRLLRQNREFFVRMRDAYRLLPERLMNLGRRVLGLLPSPVVAAEKTLLVGDHFFGSRNVDSDMPKGAPGALTLAVGESADPRIDNIFLLPTKGHAGSMKIASALAKKASGDSGGIQKKPLTWQGIQGIFSIAAFVLTSIAYPFVALPAVGFVAFGALMAFGPIAAIATGPLNGLIAKRLSARNAMALNAAIRTVLALALPAFAFFGILNFWTLLLASIANGWLFSSVMTTENIYLKRFAGPAIGAANAIFWMRYLVIQAVLGSIVGIGAYMDAWNPMVPFYISAAVHAFIVLPIIWMAIPNVKPGEKESPSQAQSFRSLWRQEGFLGAVRRVGSELFTKTISAVKTLGPKLLSMAKALREKGQSFGRKYWLEGLVFAASLGAYFVIHSTIPAALALLWWISRTDGFKALRQNKPVLHAMLLSSLMAFLIFPLQSFSLPLIAETLAGHAGKRELLGKLLGAFFFGQLIANSSQAKLPMLHLPFVGRFGGQRLVQGLVLGLIGAWVYFSLFPGSLAVTALGIAVGLALMAFSSRMTNASWVKNLGIGLSFVLLMLFGWWSLPLLSAGVLMIGLFFGPASVAISSYLYKNVPEKQSESWIAIQGSFLNAAISLGYGVTSLLATLHKPAFPATLVPVSFLYAAVGIFLFFFTRRLLPGLAAALAKPQEKPGPRPVDSLMSYKLRGWALAGLASLWGMAFTLPQAGGRLAARMLDAAASKKAVFSDFDETLGPNSGKVSKEVGDEMVAVGKAGKIMAVVTIRPSLKPGPHDVSILDSLSPIAPQDRAGMVVASLKDGYILQYDGKDQPRVLFEEPPFSEREVKLIREAAGETIAKLPSLGTAMDFDDMAQLTYGLILKAGTPEATVVQVAQILQRNLAARGLSYKVQPRLAKDPRKQPYVTFSKIDKSWAVGRISKLFGIKDEEILVLGDSMYDPKVRRYGGFAGDVSASLRRIGEWLSGRPIPLTGNSGDADMKKGRPKAMALSVGGTAYPMPNTYVMPGSWREETPRILRAVASRKAGQTTGARWAGAATAAAALLFAAAGALGWWVIYNILADLVALGENQLRSPWNLYP